MIPAVVEPICHHGTVKRALSDQIEKITTTIEKIILAAPPISQSQIAQGSNAIRVLQHAVTKERTTYEEKVLHLLRLLAKTGDHPQSSFLGSSLGQLIHKEIFSAVNHSAIHSKTELRNIIHTNNNPTAFAGIYSITAMTPGKNQPLDEGFFMHVYQQSPEAPCTRTFSVNTISQNIRNIPSFPGQPCRRREYRNRPTIPKSMSNCMTANQQHAAKARRDHESS